jgi:hypothetical protein
MRYLTAVGFGVLTGLATAILWIVVRFILPLAAPYLLSRTGTTGGIGAASAVISSASILLAALIGFIGGVAWMLLRR